MCQQRQHEKMFGLLQYLRRKIHEAFTGVCFPENDKSSKIKYELSFPIFFFFFLTDTLFIPRDAGWKTKLKQKSTHKKTSL